MSRVLRRGSEALRMPKDGIRAITMMPLTVAPSVSPSEFLSLTSTPCEAPLFFFDEKHTRREIRTPSLETLPTRTVGG
jgi:hypothetical protein